MEDDWDLQAVVRGCSTATSSSSTTSTSTTLISTRSIDAHASSSTSPLEKNENDHFIRFPDLFGPRSCGNTIQELHDLCKPFFPRSDHSLSSQSIPISPLSVLGGLQDLSPPPPPPQQQKLPQVQHQKHLQGKRSFGGSRSTSFARVSQTSIHNAQSSRSKKRKNQLKRVCQVPAEDLSSDMWSWRKYGQKPIKGSPYPRGYYRCSTSKGCLARKQVERNRSDPGMFIVTYTAEHNHPMPTHRNSLAGSTRQKPVTAHTVTAGENSKSSCSPQVSPTPSFSPGTEKMDNIEDIDDMLEEEDEDFGVSDVVINDDFFEGLEEFTGNRFSDNLSVSLTFPWLANNATTTAAGGG